MWENQEGSEKHASKYTFVYGKLYKIGRASPMMRCMDDHETTLVLVEVHKGACNNHIGRKGLAYKLLMAGYYWPTLMKYIIAFIKRCDQCKRHVDIDHTLTKLL